MGLGKLGDLRLLSHCVSERHCCCRLEHGVMPCGIACIVS